MVAGRPYLLRVMTSTEAAPGPGQGDPTRQFAGMRKAAEAGLAPRIWYTSIEDRISITDFVQARPLPRTEALARLPKTLQAVHALPAFPRRVNFLDSLEGFIRRFRAANILPESATADGGTVPRVRSSGESLSAKRSGVGVESQRPEAGKRALRWRARVAGGLGSILPERPVCRSVGGGEFHGHEGSVRRGLFAVVFRKSRRGLQAGPVLPDASGASHVLRNGFRADRVVRQAD